MTNDEDKLELVLRDLEKKGWAERTKTGWRVTDKAQAMIEKYGEKKAMKFFSIEELDIEFHPEHFTNTTLH